MTGRNKFKNNKRHINRVVNLFKILPNSLRVKILKIFSKLPGSLGVLSRYIQGVFSFKSIGDSVYISDHCVIKNSNMLSVGENFSLHEFSYIDAIGGVKIGDNVSIAHSCSILSFNHQWSDLLVPIKYNEIIKSEVIIESDVWIGCGVRILAGTLIKRRVVVAAGAVVNGILESGYIYGGVPAKKIKKL